MPQVPLAKNMGGVTLPFQQFSQCFFLFRQALRVVRKKHIFKAEASALEKVRAALKLNDAVHLQHYQRLAD